jgi:pSer/pThr/pTyr-binding forkhead associated (FHA) protein
MALTIVVRAWRTRDEGGPAARGAGGSSKSGAVAGAGADEGSGDEGELSLTFDAPRVVIGRGEGCELRLPDPSVSHRHASIRQRGGEHIIIDEKSLNGTFVERVRLPPEAPRVIRSGERVRVGRVWLEIRIEPKLVTRPGKDAAKELALALVTRGLLDQGEDPRPRVRVVEGPDAGKELRVAEPGRRYILGRGRESDLVVEDANASRRHVDIAQKGDHLVVHDLGSKTGATLDGAPLGQTDVPWKAGQVLSFGGNRLAFDYPAAEALAELDRSPDEAIPSGEAIEPPEPDVDPAASPEPSPSAPLDIAPRAPLRRAPAPASETGWSVTDGAIVILALGVLALSIAGLYLLLAK